jgi:MOSC domain-containing protein YiiM
MTMAIIRSIVYQPIDKTYDERLDYFMRVPVDEVNLIANHGIEGDAKAGHNPDRHLSLLSSEWLEEMKEKGFKTNPGDFGEQIVIQGVPLEDLYPEDRLLIGAGALVEITKVRTGCDRLQLVQGEIDEITIATIGMMAKVLNTGTIKVGDPVQVLAAYRDN